MKPPIPSNWIDAILILIVPLHPPATIMLVAVLIVIRRWSWMCGALLALLGQHEVTPWALVFLPAAAAYLEDDESYIAPSTGAEGAPTGSSTSSAQAVLPQQHQVEPALVLGFEGLIDYLKGHNLTDEQVIDLLALMRRDAGDLLSANKIRDIVGGNEAAVKARVAAWRPKPEPPRSQGRVARPDGGW